MNEDYKAKIKKLEVKVAALEAENAALRSACEKAGSALLTATYLVQYQAGIGVPAQAARWQKEYEAHYDECMLARQTIDTAIAKENAT